MTHSTIPTSLAHQRFHKLSAAGLLLPADATEWVAVHDTQQQLIWTRDVVPGGEMPWKKAMQAASACTLCGWNDWRAPSRLEYAHLIDDKLYEPAIDSAFFAVESEYQWEWTGTECTPAGYAWCVDLDYGYSYRNHQTYIYRVRAVRPSQSLAIGVGAAL